MQNYKKIAIECFYNKDFKNAKMYFSLAYQKRKNKRLLTFINICDLALQSPDEAFVFFEFFLQNYKNVKIDTDLEKLINLSQSVQLEENSEDFEGLSYQDFLLSEKEVGFKQALENVIISNKLIIDDKEDFVDFLEKLLEYGYKDMLVAYMEDVSPHFYSNYRFIKLSEKLKGLL
ncbi:histidine kinase [Campylobacter insulaenigrae]|uniref:Histidine kinase n=1 Tax=Campylobacter insulaenigrae TaxID=260714 RepID=A0ABY3G9N9_9BACT|nr:histidine kinase [Campylobacter insulaenigrae]MCR6570652.1 histidine kinase [Campylobacter insulaenigrae]MCR6572201.1 histidine kinase [Campylobacter insulaenigrae]MCR6574475.1 histidine kinase [Campylobacter insulaenigrae]MCR6576040.1 histidine kinase [Campylobacter insulaenigrae]MCR6578598.1 histidine kinase [Campylobacter insulaenigrae]